MTATTLRSKLVRSIPSYGNGRSDDIHVGFAVLFATADHLRSLLDQKLFAYKKNKIHSSIKSLTLSLSKRRQHTIRLRDFLELPVIFSLPLIVQWDSVWMIFHSHGLIQLLDEFLR
jgi:hypothetical protein